MNTKKIIIGIVIVGVLAFGYYAISPLFRNIKVDETIPVSSATKGTSETKEGTPTQITGTIGHPASGTAKIVSSDGKNYVRYENYKTINGPDLFVYLAKDLKAKEFVNLGEIKATEGNVNYEIPDGINPDDYPYVLTWCKAFGVLFNSAKVN